MLYQYDPGRHIFTFLGTPIVGYAPGTFIEVERNEDAMTLEVGTDGHGVRTRNSNKSGVFRLTLQQGSPSNDVLMAAAQADELTGTGVGPSFMKDASGRSTALAPNSWVRKPAAMGFAKEHGSRVWEIETDNLDLFVGGNNPVGV